MPVKHIRQSIPSIWVILLVLLMSCEFDKAGLNSFVEVTPTIGQYLEKNKEQYSKFHKLLVGGKMLNPLGGYNPYGDGYTLFLPTNEAVDQFILQNEKYANINDLLEDTSAVNTLVRYHTVKQRLHTDQFPDGALLDSTLTGERLAVSYTFDGTNAHIKVNNKAPIISSNLEMINGYIHVISEVLPQVEESGLEWLQQQQEYTILSEAIELSKVQYRMWWKEYTIFAEHDSVYHKKGIMNVQDLVQRLSTPGKPLSDKNNKFNQFVSYHLVGDSYYLNDLSWGSKKYWTMSNPLIIDVGIEIKINPGIDVFGYKYSAAGDTIPIDYVRVNWEYSNNMTSTGPVHSISDLLFFEPFPE